MPGYIKDTGQHRPVAAPYVKVEGQWRPVALGYVKVEGQWRIWHTAEIVDSFDRPDNAELGTASNDFSVWQELSGGWEIKENKAWHGTGAGPSIASVPLYKANTDYEISADLVGGTGLGVAFWVQDANNWHAAIPGVRVQNNPSYYYCADPSFTLDGTVCRLTTTYEASYEGPYQVDPPPYQVPVYGCPNGGSNDFGNGETCYTTTTYQATCNTTSSTVCDTPRTGGSCVPLTNTSCQCTQTSYETFNLNFIKCGPCSSGQITRSSGSCPTGTACFEYDYYCVCYGRDVGAPPCGGETCQVVVGATTTTNTTCTCDAGDEKVGSVCYKTTSYPASIVDYVTIDPAPYTEPGRGYYCPSGGSLNGTLCTNTQTQSAIFVPASTTYPSVVRVFRSLAGVVTNVFQQDISSDPASFVVTTSGSNVNIAAFSSAGLQGTRIASVTYNATGALRTTGIGLAKNGNQTQRQGQYLDNFRAK